MKTFEQLKISKSILKTLDEIGFTEPTPIQQKVIPVIRSGANVVGVAQTGTGKTAAYLIPLLMNIVKAEGDDPRVIILVPTRELAIQGGDDIEELSANTNIRHAAVYGGIGWTKHAEMIKPGIDILVSTPGRLWDLYKAGALSLKKVKHLVIDEADRMLDMGFLPQLRQLFEILPNRRQNLLFSATFPQRVEIMAEEFLDHYKKVKVALSATTVKQVKQEIYLTPNYRTKLNLIKHLLKDEETFNRIIIFVRIKEHAEAVFKVIKRKTEGEKRILHSNKGQSSRINAINAFKAGEIRILISTDVSARGLDASLVSHVINFDLPSSYDDYVHRIGRTARAGNKGVAITLIDPAQEWHMKRIEKLIRMEIPRKEIPEDMKIIKTETSEKQDQLREIDRQRKLDDPTFQGAFHERKKKSEKKPKKFFSKNSQSKKKKK
ncbi:MAG: DEAD/DEAH box helicase [Mariniphaga sp.]|nr:DEAD/DEAH box helicase [Mariniphaga sp.]